MRLATFPLTGGLNINTPIIAQKPGFAYVAQNFELAPVSGYRRPKGYERFDGRTSPSDIDFGAQREAQRNLIQPVPGAGPVRGVFILKGVVYAFRDTSTETAKKLYRATSTGWVEVSTPVLKPGGRGEFIIENFNGAPTGRACYGVDGVNKAFQFDGSTYTEIVTGVEPRTPTHLCEFRNHLFLAYPGGSLQFSVVGEPLNWSAVQGAGELAMGDEVFGVLEMQGGVLGVFCRDRVSLLTGSGAEDFILRQLSDSGVREWSVQPIFSDVIYLDKQIQRASATQNFGDFQASSLSEPVRFIVEKLLQRVQFSVVSRAKNQYYLFSNTKECLVATFNGQALSGFTTLTFPDQFNCGFAGEDALGNEAIFLAGTSGYVYWFNRGASHDGKPISAYLLLAPNHLGSYEQNKRFRRIIVEADIVGDAGLQVLAEFNYGADPRTLPQFIDGRFAGGLFDLSNLNEAVWSGDLKGYGRVYINGHGRNISILIFNSSDAETEFTIESMSIAYDLRGKVR